MFENLLIYPVACVYYVLCGGWLVLAVVGVVIWRRRANMGRLCVLVGMSGLLSWVVVDRVTVAMDAEWQRALASIGAGASHERVIELLGEPDVTDGAAGSGPRMLIYAAAPRRAWSHPSAAFPLWRIEPVMRSRVLRRSLGADTTARHVQAMVDGAGESVMIQIDSHGKVAWKRRWPEMRVARGD